MVKEYSRTSRVAQEIKKRIAIILQRNIKDPRVRIVTVSGVEISRDLEYVKVFVTFLNDNNSCQEKNAIRLLQNASGFIRSLLGKVMRLRVIPVLTFSYDPSIRHGMRMSSLVNQVIENDRQRCKLSALEKEDT